MAKIDEPDFDGEQDLLVKVTDEKYLNDSVEGLSLTANVLLFSYNRPKMLREAIASVMNQTYKNFNLFVVDDGSDLFVAEDLLSEYDDERLIVAQASRISMTERLAHSRLAENANAVIQTIPDNEPVYYLCDDDLFHPNWFSRSIRAFQNLPNEHIVQGESWYFNEGQDYVTESVYGMPKDEPIGFPTMYWSTGSFAHRAACCKLEGLWWTDNKYLHSQDTNFIKAMWGRHPNWVMISSPAVYRREHDNTLSAKLGRKGDDGRYLPGYRPPPATQQMLEEME